MDEIKKSTPAVTEVEKEIPYDKYLKAFIEACIEEKIEDCSTFSEDLYRKTLCKEMEKYIYSDGRHIIKMYLQDERELFKRKRRNHLVSIWVPVIVASITTVIFHWLSM